MGYSPLSQAQTVSNPRVFKFKPSYDRQEIEAFLYYYYSEKLAPTSKILITLQVLLRFSICRKPKSNV